MLQHNCGYLFTCTSVLVCSFRLHSLCEGKGLNWKSGNWSSGPGCVINLLEAQFPYLKNDVRLMISGYFLVLKCDDMEHNLSI